MTHGDIEDVNVKEAGQFIKDMTGIGVLIPDDGLEELCSRDRTSS